MSAATRELIIVGSGPAGYTAAIYAARAGLAPLVLEGTTGGGSLMNTTEVENFPGFAEGLQGPDLMAAMRAQSQRFGAELVAEYATGMELAGPTKTIRAGDRSYSASAVVLAMGSAYRTLGIDGEERLSGRGVSWCATCDGFFFRQREIAVVGGGDSAIEEALFLTRFASKVTVIHRREQLRASQIMQDRARADEKIAFLWDTEVTQIHGENSVSGVTVTDRKRSGQPRLVELRGLFVAIGHTPRSELVADHVDLNDAGYVVTFGGTTRTSVEGVFACGDLVDHRYRQAITAAGSGCSAALDAQRYLTDQTAGRTDVGAVAV